MFHSFTDLWRIGIELIANTAMEIPCAWNDRDGTEVSIHGRLTTA